MPIEQHLKQAIEQMRDSPAQLTLLLYTPLCDCPMVTTLYHSNPKARDNAFALGLGPVTRTRVRIEGDRLIVPPTLMAVGAEFDKQSAETMGFNIPLTSIYQVIDGDGVRVKFDIAAPTTI